MPLPDGVRLTGSGPHGAITVADIRAAVPGGIRRPPATPVPTPFPWSRGPTLQIDRYSLRPLTDIVRQLPGQPNPHGGPEPTMFSTGDLPLFTTSGVEVDLLRWVPWTHRNSAAAAPDRATVYQMIEDADLLQVDPRAMQNTQGTEAFQRYRAAVWRWATAAPPREVMSEVQYEEWEAASNPAAGGIR
jgi:hypothetical protein